MRRSFSASAPPSMLRSPRFCATGFAFFSASASRGFVLSAERVVKPGPGEGPGAVRGTAGDSQGLGSFPQRQAGEEAELYQLGASRVFPPQLLQGLVQGEQVIGGFLDGKVHLFQAQPATGPAPLEASLV